MIEEIVDLLKRLPRGLNSSDDEKLRTLLKRLMTIQNTSSNNLYSPAEVGTDSDKLDGQHGSYYQNATNLNAGTVHTDRFSAYSDLVAESKIGAGATQVPAGDHTHAGTIINPMTTAGDMIYQPGSYTVANSDATGNKVINATPSSTEKIIPVCDLEIADPVGNITITWDAWASMNQLGTVKKVTVRLRRDDLNGAILWSLEKTMATDSVLGHDQRFNGSMIDTAVTTGRYVLTSDATGASVVDIYGDTRTFTLAGYTNTPSRLPLGAVAGYVLAVNAGATAPEWANMGVTNGDTHDHSGGDGAQIDHTTLSNVGTNSHTTIDSHLSSTSNPHSVTKTQVGLGSVANILDKLDATVAPTINEDSGDGYSIGSHWLDVTADKAYVALDVTVGAAVWKEISTASATDVDAIHDNVAGEIAAITEKTTPVDADVTIIEDSAATNAKKKLSWVNIKATLKTYFDTLYPADGNVFHKNVISEIIALDDVVDLSNNIYYLVEEVSAGNSKKKHSYTNLRLALKTYFDTLYAIAAKGVTNGDTHDHLGGDGGTIAHTSLSAIGTNTHTAIDTFIASKGAASGLASLNASSLVVQEPASKGVASGLASLNASSLVVENPANATATPTASKIPIADASGDLDPGWLGTDWTDYTCTMSGSTGSAGTYAEDLAYARYAIIGGICHVVVRKRITNLGSWTGDVRLTYPVTKPAGIGGVFGGGYVYANGAAITAPKGVAAVLTGAYCQFYKTILAYLQWSDLAVNDHVFINLTYEV